MQAPTLKGAARALRGSGARAARPWIRGLARAGYAAKAVQYATIGLLAALFAIGSADGTTTGSKGALHKLGEQPFGQVLLVLMAIGLAGYALWRFVEAILDPERTANGTKGVFKRIGHFANGLTHSALVVYAVGLLTGAAERGGGAGRDGAAARSWSAQLMAWPGGVWVVGAVGIGVVAFAIAELVDAWKARLDERLDLSPLRPRSRAFAIEMSRFGIAARAVVFALMGTFLVVAAQRTEPGRAKGLGEALRTVQGWTLGWLVLTIIAIGLIAYGAYELLEARYRRIQPMPA
jgi:hypothetical protein